ncbi:dihydroorotate dehydrogenase [Methanococcus maripaludis]|uniref:Dihydroorotate dehydrogenase n=1 Tax=Methanococcus maripaludis TaxID=39152 RepID=A0A2L1C9E5_METMI|nr:dihydroorotate dehydrogenase [Methanococcus maripaludis]AVB76008.1 Dihydroorotate dehydrogenase B, catalytic subunit [Methanococcus maripaludis]MBA2864470.1 dihydroorotate dehydrogenase (NAD+) catalytic subunit [Methanococcus maripaludis]MBB6497748.1 dihydroorotate dehydrogenase (NAD+) catalytic subunit [Methanococcus maripaludis]
MLKTKLWDIEFKNPVFLAAGVMGETGSALKRMAKNGAGAVCTKSVGIEKKPGHNNPTMVEVEGGFLNAMGLPNPGADEYAGEIERIKDEMKRMNVKIIGSIYGKNDSEFQKAAEVIATHVDVLELNISCPHAGGGYGSSIGQDPCLCKNVVSAVKDVSDIPVIAKLTPNVTDIKEIASAVVNAGADGIVAINTLGPGMVIDIESGVPILGNKVGGMSGKAIKPIAVKNVYDICSAVDVPVIGVGGITTGADAIEFMMAGASAVQVGTGVYYRGYDIFQKINNEIEEYLLKKDLKMSDIIGIAQK